MSTPATNPPRCPNCGALPGCAVRPCPVCNPARGVTGGTPIFDEAQALPGFRAVFRHSLTPTDPARSVVVGAQPMVLIEPEMGAGDAMNFALDVTDLEPLELADLLVCLAEAVRAEVGVQEQSL